MLDEITVTARIAKKLRELFDRLKADQVKQLDLTIDTFQVTASQKVNAWIETMNGEIQTRADQFTGSLNNSTISRVKLILDQVKQYAENKVNGLVASFQDLAGKALDTIKSDAQTQIKDVLSNVKKGDRGERGLKGEQGDQGEKGEKGVGVEKVTQPTQDTMRIRLTDGKEFPITLPRGPRGPGGGGGGQSASSTTPTIKPKSPVFSYTDGLLTRIDYDDASYKLFTYDTGTLTRIDYVKSTGTTRKDFNYTDGLLTSIVETEII